MKPNQAEIITYKKYSSSIEASVSKTKLDAYGIPCFLSNENISNLYPLPYMTGMEVTLHIFKEDIERVEEVLGASE